MSRNNRLLIFSGWAFLSDVWRDWTAAFSNIEIKVVDWNDCSNYIDIQAKAALELSRFPDTFVMGWSLGSLAAIEAVFQFQDLAKGLLLVNPTPSFAVREDFPSGVDRRILGIMRRKTLTNPEAVLQDFYQKALSSPHPWNDRDSFLSRLDNLKSNISRHSLDPGLEYLEKKDLRLLVPGLHVPMLVFSARYDALCPPDAAQWISNHSGGESRLIHYDDAGHVLPFSHTSHVQIITEDFIHG